MMKKEKSLLKTDIKHLEETFSIKIIPATNKVSANLKQDDTKDLIAKYQPQLKSFIRGKISNKDDADDILQDVFYQLIKTLNTAMNPIENISAWLYKVTRNTIINAGLKKKEEKLPYFQDDEGNDIILKDFSEVLFHNNSNPEAEYLRSLVWTELENALSELPVEQREVFEMTELDGIPLKEISKTTGVPVNTLLSRKHYAVKFLREKLAGLYEDLIYS